MDRLIAFLQKDFRILIRERSLFVFPIVFALICTVLFSMVLPKNIVSVNRYELLWIVFLFISVFPSLDFIMYERDFIGHFSALRLGTVFFLSKFLLVLFTTWIFGIFIFFMFFFFLNFIPSSFMFLSFFLSAFGMSSLSVLFSLYVVKGDMGLPIYILLFPLYIPLVISAVELGYGNLSALKILIGFNVINFSLSFALFELGD